MKLHTAFCCGVLFLVFIANQMVLCSTACPAGFTYMDAVCEACSAGKYKAAIGSAPCVECETGKYVREQLEFEVSGWCVGDNETPDPNANGKYIQDGYCYNQPRYSHTDEYNNTFYIYVSGDTEDVDYALFITTNSVCAQANLYAHIRIDYYSVQQHGLDLSEFDPAYSPTLYLDDTLGARARQWAVFCSTGWQWQDSTPRLLSNFTESAGTGATSCESCAVGTYSTDSGATSSSTCQSCPNGAYQNDTGASLCRSCAENEYLQYDENILQLSMTWDGDAKRGDGALGIFTLHSETINNKPTYKNTQGLFLYYFNNFNPHQWAISSTLGDRFRIAFVEVTSLPELATTTVHRAADDAYFFNDAYGHFLPITLHVEILKSELRGFCTNCPAGTVSPAGSFTALSCQCGAGLTGPDGGACAQCAAGKYKATAGNSSCHSCAPGTYSHGGASACTDCTAGRLGAAGATECDIDPVLCTCPRNSQLGGTAPAWENAYPDDDFVAQLLPDRYVFNTDHSIKVTCVLTKPSLGYLLFQCFGSNTSTGNAEWTMTPDGSDKSPIEFHYSGHISPAPTTTFRFVPNANEVYAADALMFRQARLKSTGRLGLLPLFYATPSSEFSYIFRYVHVFDMTTGAKIDLADIPVQNDQDGRFFDATISDVLWTNPQNPSTAYAYSGSELYLMTIDTFAQAQDAVTFTSLQLRGDDGPRVSYVAVSHNLSKALYVKDGTFYCAHVQLHSVNITGQFVYSDSYDTSRILNVAFSPNDLFALVQFPNMISQIALESCTDALYLSKNGPGIQSLPLLDNAQHVNQLLLQAYSQMLVTASFIYVPYWTEQKTACFSQYTHNFLLATTQCFDNKNAIMFTEAPSINKTMHTVYATLRTFPSSMFTLLVFNESSMHLLFRYSEIASNMLTLGVSVPTQALFFGYENSSIVKWPTTCVGTFCRKCSAGTGQSSPWLDSSTRCVDCTQGEYRRDGDDACNACRPGSYAPVPGSSVCTLCAQGTFSNESGVTACSECATAQYTQAPGGESCLSCALAPGNLGDAPTLTPRPSPLAHLFTPDSTAQPQAPRAKISPNQTCLAVLLDDEQMQGGRSRARVLVLGTRSGTHSEALTLEGTGSFVDFAVTDAAVFAVFAGADVSVARIELDQYCRPSAVSQALHRNSSFVSLLRTCQHEHAVRPIQYTYVGPGYCMGLANEFYANPYTFYFFAHDVGPVQCKNACDVDSSCIGYHHHPRNNECHKYYAHYHEANADPRFKFPFGQWEDESAYSITSHDNDGGACYRKNMDSRGIAFADTTDAYVLLCEAENTSTVAGALALDTGLLQPWPDVGAGVPRLVQFLADDGENTSFAVHYAKAAQARLLARNSTGAFVHLRALEPQNDRDWVYAADAVRATTGAAGGELLFLPGEYPRVAELFANGRARAWQLRGCLEYEISKTPLFGQLHAHALLFARADCKATDELVDPAKGCVSAVGAYPNATEFYVRGDLGFLRVATCSTHQQFFPEALHELIFNNSSPQRKLCAQSIACEYGSLPAAGDATQCACRAGFAVHAETGGCEACVPGKFSDSTAAPNCTLCPAATPFSHRASTSARSCFAAYGIRTRDPGVLGELHALAHAVHPAGDTVAVHEEAAALARASMSELRAQLRK